MAMTLRLPDELQDALRTTAEREHRSMQAVALEAIERYTSERARRLDAVVDRVLADDADLIHRLGTM